MMKDKFCYTAIWLCNDNKENKTDKRNTNADSSIKLTINNSLLPL